MAKFTVSRDCWLAVKQYLVDVDGISQGEFVEHCILFAMGRLEELEEEIGIVESDEEEEEEESESEEIEEEED